MAKKKLSNKEMYKAKLAKNRRLTRSTLNRPTSNEQTGVDPKTGRIKPGKIIPAVTGAELGDAERNFYLGNTAQTTDEFGNVTTNELDPATGKPIRTTKQGQPLASTLGAFQQGMGGYQWNLGSQVKAAQDANYNYITKDYGQQKAQEAEDLKQELANRGIPLGSGLYDHQMQQLESKWQGVYDQAKNQAIAAGNQTLATQSGVQNQNIGTMANTAQAFTSNASPYQATNRDLSGAILQGAQVSSNANQNIYGINKNYDAQMKQIAAQKEAEANRLKAIQQQAQGPGVVFNG